jgi:hypothetical protein
MVLVGFVEVEVRCWKRAAVDWFLVPPLQQRYVVYLSVRKIHCSADWEISIMIQDSNQGKEMGLRNKDVADFFFGRCVEVVAQRCRFENLHEEYWIAGEKRMVVL